jgi:alcohol dehydrogenase class IV
VYEFHWPTKTVFKPDLSQNLSKYLPPEAGEQLMIIAPREKWVIPLIERFKSNLLEANWKRVTLFPEVEPNPSWATVNKGVDFALNAQPSAILAVGGGSTMDAAKVIAQKSEIPQLITIPTTSGTGGEISPWAVISNLTTREKDSMVAKWPDLSLLDPVLTFTVPPLVTLFTGIDAFIHGLEAYLASSANSITDALALLGMKMVVEHLNTAIESRTDLQARSGMLEGSLLTGAAMLHAGLGLMHAIGNVTGGLYHDLPHGLILMRCMNAVLEYNQPNVGGKFDEVSELVEKILQITDHQFQRMEVPKIIVEEKDLQLLAQRAVANVNAKTNPRPAGIEEVKKLVEQSFEIL